MSKPNADADLTERVMKAVSCTHEHGGQTDHHWCMRTRVHQQAAVRALLAAAPSATPEKVAAGHRPTLRATAVGVGWVGCECMTTRAWHGYLTQHGGPPHEAWLQHVLADQPPQGGPQPDERETLADLLARAWSGSDGNRDLTLDLADAVLAAGFRRVSDVGLTEEERRRIRVAQSNYGMKVISPDTIVVVVERILAARFAALQEGQQRLPDAGPNFVAPSMEPLPDDRDPRA